MFKEYVFGNWKIELKQLTPLDFLEEELGCPINIFQVKKEETVISVEIKSKEESDKEDDFYKSLFSKCVGRLKFKNKDVSINYFFDKMSKDSVSSIVTYTIHLSIPNFKTVRVLSETHINYIHKFAIEYGKTPIDILSQNGNFTDFEAFIFNRFIFIEVNSKEVKKVKKEEQQAFHEKIRRKNGIR